MNRSCRSLLAAALPALLASGCHNAKTESGAAKGGSVTLTTDEDKIFYAMGLNYGRHLSMFKPTEKEVALVKEGLADQALGRKTQVELKDWGPRFQQLMTTRQAAAAETEKARAKEFLTKAAAEAGATTTPSGMVYKTIKPGSGESPGPHDKVKVHYHGTLTDGTVFDSSVQRGTPAEFGLDMIIPCWKEGLQKMKLGEKVKLTCPSAIGYGDQGHPPAIPGGATLVFEVELLSIDKAPAGAAPGMPGAGPPGTMPPGGGPPPGMGMRPGMGMPPGGSPPGGMRPGMGMPPGHPGMNAPGGRPPTPPPGAPPPR